MAGTSPGHTHDVGRSVKTIFHAATSANKSFYHRPGRKKHLASPSLEKQPLTRGAIWKKGAVNSWRRTEIWRQSKFHLTGLSCPISRMVCKIQWLLRRQLPVRMDLIQPVPVPPFTCPLGFTSDSIPTLPDLWHLSREPPGGIASVVWCTVGKLAMPISCLMEGDFIPLMVSPLAIWE